ncbi:hypothetical protein GCM10027418_07020 [Mariniluteicoccus endophyticus]
MGDLLRLDLGERPAEHREVLSEDGDAAAVDLAEAGDDAVPGEVLVGHAEVVDVVGGQRAEFLEGALVEQDRQALARGQFPFRVLLVDAARTAAGQCLLAQFAQA